MTTLAVLQPGYFPWLGALEQLYRSDVFVVYDDVQYDKGGWRNRNRIRTPAPDGWSWLTVPVQREHLTARSLIDVRIDDHSGWRRKHWRSLEMHYGRSPGWPVLRGRLAELYAERWQSLVELDLAAWTILTEGFEIRRPTLRASELDAKGHKTARLVALAREVHADRYYSGAAAKAYLDVQAMTANGITVVFQSFTCLEYPQQYRPFVPYLSSIDLLLNVGASGIDRVIRGGLT